MLNWNEKHLNYEIETRIEEGIASDPAKLKWKASQLWDWNIHDDIVAVQYQFNWNEKHLNYEIETKTDMHDGERAGF